MRPWRPPGRPGRMSRWRTGFPPRRPPRRDDPSALGLLSDRRPRPDAGRRSRHLGATASSSPTPYAPTASPAPPPAGSPADARAIGGLVGRGVTLAPATAREQELRIKDAKTTPSICPFCSVGCATLIHTVDGKIVNIEGDPRSPHNEGTLCPKGAAIYQLHMNPNRATKVLHRKPGASDWEVVELEWAMDRVAELTKKTRDETFIERLPNGKLVNMTPAIFALGGATLDNEFNHGCQKFWRGH